MSVFTPLLRRAVNVLPVSARARIGRMPVVGALQRRIVTHLSGTPFLHTINAGPARGLRIEVTLPRDKAIWAGTYEQVFASALREGVAPGDVCYDIGGYRGYTAGVFALAGAKSVVVCEPLPGNIAALQQLVQLNPSLPIVIEAFAAGQHDGSTKFRIMPDKSMGKMISSPFQPDRAYQSEIDVNVVRVDTLVFERGLPPPNVMKVDVEGAELEVLNGAERTLRELRPKVYLEAHTEALAAQCSARLRTFGYHTHQFEPEPLRPRQTRHILAVAH